jgi:ubiquinone/menaquinone biosynthesis C-methylase UbiE
LLAGASAVEQTALVEIEPGEASDFYTGLVADVYRHLRSETFDPDPYARFVERSGQPALELGCGDGDPILDLLERGLDVHGLDSSADMLDRCRAAARERGLDVTLHHATFEAMDLGQRYRSIYLAGATFNLLTDDSAAQRALERIAAHLEPGGSALIPLFVPQQSGDSTIGHVRKRAATDGSTMSVTVLDFRRDEAKQRQTTRLRYEWTHGEVRRVTEREWILHWIERDLFAEMAERAGLSTKKVFAIDAPPTTPHDTAFTFVLQRPAS